MNKNDLITIIGSAGLDDATAKIVIKEIESNSLSQSSTMIIQSVLAKGRFGSRSEASRYAANVRWAKSPGAQGNPTPVGPVGERLQGSINLLKDAIGRIGRYEARGIRSEFKKTEPLKTIVKQAEIQLADVMRRASSPNAGEAAEAQDYLRRFEGRIAQIDKTVTALPTTPLKGERKFPLNETQKAYRILKEFVEDAGVTIMEKKYERGVDYQPRFGSRSEAGRYAANIRWQMAGNKGGKAGVHGGASDAPVQELNKLLAAGFTVQTIRGDDKNAIDTVTSEAKTAFQAAAKSDPQNEARRLTGWNMVKLGLKAGLPEDTHHVLRDPDGRIAGVMTVTYGQPGGRTNPTVAIVQTLGTTGLVKGAGTALMGQVITGAKAANNTHVQLESLDDAMPFYKGLGFKQFRTNELNELTNEMELKI